MFLISLFSAACLLTCPSTINPSIEIIREHHLETEEGRNAFLVEKLVPYTQTAGHLNEEITVLSEQIQALSPAEDQDRILSLTEAATEKMGQLVSMMPVLNAATSIEEDFKQISSILNQAEPLTPEQQEIADRVASLCGSVE